MRLRRLAVTVAVIVLATVAPAANESVAGSSDPALAPDWLQRETEQLPVFSKTGLEGLAKITVRVQPLDPEFARLTGISRDEIRTQVELYLRQNTPLRLVEPLYPDAATLGVALNGRIVGSAMAFVSLQFAVLQTVELSRTMSGRGVVVLAAATWRSTGTCGGPPASMRDEVRAGIGACLDEFQNEYLKANPQIRSGAGSATLRSEPMPPPASSAEGAVSGFWVALIEEKYEAATVYYPALAERHGSREQASRYLQQLFGDSPPVEIAAIGEAEELPDSGDLRVSYQVTLRNGRSLTGEFIVRYTVEPSTGYVIVATP